MKLENEAEKKLRNLQEFIVNDAYRRKEKVIAIDSETFEEVRGKEVRLKIQCSFGSDERRINKIEVKLWQ